MDFKPKWAKDEESFKTALSRDMDSLSKLVTLLMGSESGSKYGPSPGLLGMLPLGMFSRGYKGQLAKNARSSATKGGGSFLPGGFDKEHPPLLRVKDPLDGEISSAADWLLKNHGEGRVADFLGPWQGRRPQTFTKAPEEVGGGVVESTPLMDYLFSLGQAEKQIDYLKKYGQLPKDVQKGLSQGSPVESYWGFGGLRPE